MKKLRHVIQLGFAILLNSDFFNVIKIFISGKARVSATVMKNICIPGLNCYSCPSALGACPIGALQFYLNDVSLKIQLKEKLNLAGLYILGFFGLTGILGGRLFCGWVCPFGALQELINRITKKNVTLPNLLEKGRFVILAIFVFILPLSLYNISLLSPWFCKLICPSGTLLAGIPLLLIDKDLRSSASYITLLKFAILLFIIISLLFSNRFFCKTMCPLGAIWGIFNRISIFNINYDKNSCISCGKCSNKCPMNLDVINEYRSSKCIRCLECNSACPTNSLTYGKFKN